MLKLTNACRTFDKDTVNEEGASVSLNLHLRLGDFVTIIGGNNAGKDALLNLITGMSPCGGGKIELDG